MQGYCGYCFRYCPVCLKEVFFFILEGENCRAYICRNYQTHKEASRATNVVVGIPHSLPQVPKGTDPAKL